MQNRSNRGSGKPVWVRAHQARAFDWDPIQRIALGPAAMCAASKGRTHDCTRPDCNNLKTILANREPFSNRISLVKCFSFVAALGSRFSPRSAKTAATSGPKPRRCKVHNGLSCYDHEAQGPPSQSPAPSPHGASITFGVKSE